MGRPRSETVPAGQRRYLRMLAAGPRVYSICDSSLTALMRRGLVEKGEMHGQWQQWWHITPAGLRTLVGNS